MVILGASRLRQRLLFLLGGLLGTALGLAGCNLATGAQPTPLPTPDIPRVAIITPLNNQQVFEGTVFDIDIVGRDETAGVARIALLVDESPINEATPIEAAAVPVLRVKMNWLAQGEGFHVIEAVAYRADGTRSDSALINVEVIPREAAPNMPDVAPTPTPTPDA